MVTAPKSAYFLLISTAVGGEELVSAGGVDAPHLHLGLLQQLARVEAEEVAHEGQRHLRVLTLGLRLNHGNPPCWRCLRPVSTFKVETPASLFATNAYKNPDDDPSLDTVKANRHTGWYVIKMSDLFNKSIGQSFQTHHEKENEQ
jgi:hypothetical protein